MNLYKEIFIFVVGSTPQIVTETINALALEKNPIFPHEIIIITTKEGQRIAKESLIDNKILEALFEEYNIPKCDIKFEIPQDRLGNQLEDIRTKEDNDAVSNLINRVVKEKAEDKENRLHCSIAGGRKTMSFYLGAALQLFGRKQDKLYHVLISPEFETNKNFFYKPKKNRQIKTHNGKILNTKYAEICLAELPFIRIGEKIKIDEDNFKSSVESGQEAIDDAIFIHDLILDTKRNQLKIGAHEITLPPTQFGLYLTIVELKKNCKKDNCRECEECYMPKYDWNDNLKQLYIDFCRKAGFKSEKKPSISPEIIASYVCKINQFISKKINNNSLSQSYMIKSITGCRFKTKYYIAIDKGKIKIMEDKKKRF